MDLNDDGKVDVADLVFLMKTIAPETPIAFFALTSLEINEGDNRVTVRVNFTTHYSGILRFAISGTASEGTDYQSLGRNIQVEGVRADIPITIFDDFDMEGEETIVISLDPNQSDPNSVFIGVPQEYTLRIKDNDALWKGGLQVENLSIGFDMLIKQKNTLFLATVTSDGYGGIPSGEWPVKITITHNAFSALIGPIAISEQDTLLGSALNRTILLEAFPDTEEDHVFDLVSVIVGRMTDRIESQSEDKRHLDTFIQGSFSLIRGVSRASLDD